MKILQRLGLFTVSLMIVGALTSIAGKAAITVTTPNSAIVNYTLAAGATSSPITPVTSQPVIVIGSNNDATNFAVSTVTLVHIQGKMLKWIGQETTGAAIHGGSASLGSHIVYLDAGNKVAIQVFSADQFVIHNGSTASASGSVKLIW